jgi:hypothetical protein
MAVDDGPSPGRSARISSRPSPRSGNRAAPGLGIGHGLISVWVTWIALEDAVDDGEIAVLQARRESQREEFFDGTAGEQRAVERAGQGLRIVQIFIDQRGGEMGREIFVEQLLALGVQHAGIASPRRQAFQHLRLPSPPPRPG